ncbi:sulfotransferase family 2 domain-containing protein [uncultured Winogradskyella sp.]|uniref:sulfotransferase family 2 domain-containing protein n=1 Tax=uncultured Winogradskyella sp. TaxID=395353 RepID=UPI00262B1A37|nr:sulfotransferase family 2 domain-containing protein [uncultured Winogradskyella sp.]
MRTFLKRRYKRFKAHYARYVYNKNAPYLKQYDRVYHVHIRKSAGTSINSAFWNIAGLNLKSVKRKALLIKGSYVFVRNNENLINDGCYFYANSHIPYWNLNIPTNTFVFCMLRDPYKRLVSLYRYLKWVKDLDPKEATSIEPYYNTIYKQTVWLGNSFNDFLDNVPMKHIQNQLYMFSETGNVEEALHNISKLDAIYHQEKFEEAITDLSLLIGKELQVKKERVFGKNETIVISYEEELKAREKLAKAYQFYNNVQLKVAKK